MNETLYRLCRHCVSVMDGWMPYPAWAIAKQTGVSVSTARRRLRKLKEQGYVRTVCENLAPSDEMPAPYRGWAITKKSKETEEYKKAYNEEMEIRRSVWPDMFQGGNEL